MSKVKVYELAKELGKDSKDVVKFLEGKNIEVKNHMSTISEDEAAMVKKALAEAKPLHQGMRLRQHRRRKISCMYSARRIPETVPEMADVRPASCRWSKGTAECKADAGTERKTGTGKQAGSKTCR